MIAKRKREKEYWSNIALQCMVVDYEVYTLFLLNEEVVLIIKGFIHSEWWLEYMDQMARML